MPTKKALFLREIANSGEMYQRLTSDSALQAEHDALKYSIKNFKKAWCICIDDTRQPVTLFGAQHALLLTMYLAVKRSGRHIWRTSALQAAADNYYVAGPDNPLTFQTCNGPKGPWKAKDTLRKSKSLHSYKPTHYNENTGSMLSEEQCFALTAKGMREGWLLARRHAELVATFEEKTGEEYRHQSLPSGNAIDLPDEEEQFEPSEELKEEVAKASFENLLAGNTAIPKKRGKKGKAAAAAIATPGGDSDGLPSNKPAKKKARRVALDDDDDDRDDIIDVEAIVAAGTSAAPKRSAVLSTSSAAPRTSAGVSAPAASAASRPTPLAAAASASISSSSLAGTKRGRGGGGIHTIAEYAVDDDDVGSDGGTASARPYGASAHSSSAAHGGPIATKQHPAGAAPGSAARFGGGPSVSVSFLGTGPRGRVVGSASRSASASSGHPVSRLVTMPVPLPSAGVGAKGTTSNAAAKPPTLASALDRAGSIFDLDVLDSSVEEDFKSKPALAAAPAAKPDKPYKQEQADEIDLTGSD